MGEVVDLNSLARDCSFLYPFSPRNTAIRCMYKYHASHIRVPEAGIANTWEKGVFGVWQGVHGAFGVHGIVSRHGGSVEVQAGPRPTRRKPRNCRGALGLNGYDLSIAVKLDQPVGQPLERTDIPIQQNRKQS